MTTKIVYQYDIAGMYLGETEADESPLEPGVFLIPARCVTVKPPQYAGDKWPRWNGAEWQLITCIGCSCTRCNGAGETSPLNNQAAR